MEPIYNKRMKLNTKRVVSHCLGLFLFLISFTGFSQTVQLQKGVSNASPPAGSVVNYLLNYKCASVTNACSGVQITDILPAGLTYNGAAAPSGATVSESSGTVTVDFAGGTLAAGSTGQVVISVIVPSGTPVGTIFSNTADMTSSNAGNTSSSVTFTSANNLPLTPGVVANKSGTGSTSPGGAGFFNLYHGNTGADPVPNYVVTDEFPAGQTLGGSSIIINPFPGTNNNIDIFYQSSPGGSWNAWPGNPRANSGTSANIPASEVGGTVYGLKFEYGTVPGGGSFYPGSLSTNDNGVIAFDFKIDANVATGTSVKNCMSVSGGGVSTATACQEVFIQPPTNDLFSYKGTFPAGPFTVGQEIFTFLGMQFPPQNVESANGFVFADLLPVGLSYVANSWVFQESAGTDWVNAGSPAPTFEQISNYAGTGRTLLRWKFAPSAFTAVANGSNKQYQINLKVAATVPGTFNNCYSASVSSPATFNTMSGQITDNLDLNGNGSTSDPVTNSCTTFDVTGQPIAAGLNSKKEVLGQLDSQYSTFPTVGQTVSGGTVDYRLTLTNPNAAGVTGIKIVDVFPYVGDMGVLDPQPRNSMWRPVLVAPIVPPAGITVLYNTSSTPNYNTVDMSTGSGWTSTPPSDITMVRAVAFDFGSIVINQNDTKTIDLKLLAPLSAPTNGDIAWNSFAFGSVRADNGDRLLSSEPIKVGVAAQPLPNPGSIGDRVWVDTNQNGIQDEGTLTGVDGVAVDLFNSNNILVGSTVTASGGNYSFPNLPPGNYYVKFSAIPTQYTVSPTGQGGNPALDSDGLQTATVSISAGTNITTLDLGLYEVNTCNAPVPTGTGLARCGEGTVSLSASGCTAGYTAKWFTDAAGNSAASGTNAGNNYTTPSISATTDYYVLCQDDATASCKSATTKVTAIVNPNPTISATTACNAAGTQFDISYTATAGATVTSDKGTLDAANNKVTGVTSGETATLTATLNGCQTTTTATQNCASPLGSIGDYVWLDNGDNVQGTSDSPIKDVKVYLLNAAGTKIDSTTTGNDGKYLFSNLPLGTYSVQFVAPAGQSFVTAIQGGNTALDSDAGVDGKSAQVTLTTTTPDVLTLDAGIKQPVVPVGSIGDYVFLDKDNSGTQTAKIGRAHV